MGAFPVAFLQPRLCSGSPARSRDSSAALSARRRENRAGERLGRPAARRGPRMASEMAVATRFSNPCPPRRRLARLVIRTSVTCRGHNHGDNSMRRIPANNSPADPALVEPSRRRKPLGVRAPKSTTDRADGVPLKDTPPGCARPRTPSSISSWVDGSTMARSPPGRSTRCSNAQRSRCDARVPTSRVRIPAGAAATATM